MYRPVGQGGGADGWRTTGKYSSMGSCTHYNCTASACPHTEKKQEGKRKGFLTLTASMPESCMPMLTTAMVMSCQRTQRSVNRPQTETVWMEDRDRCSSCISSTSAWMFSLVRYHFKAEGQKKTDSLLRAHWDKKKNVIVCPKDKKDNRSF